MDDGLVSTLLTTGSRIVLVLTIYPLYTFIAVLTLQFSAYDGLPHPAILRRQYVQEQASLLCYAWNTQFTFITPR